ncbi:hypothetical protein Cni_G24173 [Canna indica]|uniref:Uncharacterized protein n=1 Tax=Canna indica TaxID=4628 RepID=A0AAQ3L1Y8_9LILI|nr:hypothetical protein Cni_G24173 [Canna indica]
MPSVSLLLPRLRWQRLLETATTGSLNREGLRSRPRLHSSIAARNDRTDLLSHRSTPPLRIQFPGGDSGGSTISYQGTESKRGGLYVLKRDSSIAVIPNKGKLDIEPEQGNP